MKIRIALAAAILSFSTWVGAEPLDLNNADAQTLAETLKGVGESKAQAIINYREQHGPFQSVDDLEKVSGIGPRLLEQNRNRVMVHKPQVVPQK